MQSSPSRTAPSKWSSSPARPALCFGQAPVVKPALTRVKSLRYSLATAIGSGALPKLWIRVWRGAGNWAHWARVASTSCSSAPSTVPIQETRLNALTEYAAEHPEAAVIGTKLLDLDGNVEHAGLAFDGEKKPLALRRLPGQSPGRQPLAALRAVSGACFLIRRAVYETLGGLDPAYGTYADLDFCLRATERGHEVHYCHRSVLTRATAPRPERDASAGIPGWSAPALFAQRWAPSIDSDHLGYYERDGLLTLTQSRRAGYPLRLTLSPLVGVTPAAQPDPLASRADRLLAQRARQVQTLLEQRHLARRNIDQQYDVAHRDLSQGHEDFFQVRARIAREFLRGSGIEIGPLHSPLTIPPEARVRYVDRLSVEALRQQYPELNHLPLVAEARM